MEWKFENNYSASKIIKTWSINWQIISKLKHKKSSTCNSFSRNIWRFRKISIVSERSKFCLGWTQWSMHFFFSGLLLICVVVKFLWIFLLDLNSFELNFEFCITRQSSVKFCKWIRDKSYVLLKISTSSFHSVNIF